MEMILLFHACNFLGSKRFSAGFESIKGLFTGVFTVGLLSTKDPLLLFVELVQDWFSFPLPSSER